MTIKMTCFFLLMSLAPVAYSLESVDPFDMSASSNKVEELGVVTRANVDALEDRVTEHFNAGNCTEALPLLDEYSRKSNWLANIIASTLEPFYNASRQERESISLDITELAELERLANEYKSKRNYAFAMMGDCYLQLGDEERAIPVLSKTLDLLSIDDQEWWAKTRRNLLEVVGVE